MAIEHHRDGPWELPEGWVWARLGTLGHWSGGGTPSKSNEAFWTGGSIPWISPKDMKTDIVGDSEDRITEAAVANSSTKLVPAYSVLMVVRSGILSHTFPVATCDREVTLNQDMRALIPFDGIDARYACLVIRRLQRHILEECSKDGTTVASVEPSRLEKVWIPLAPAAEQRRIVTRIDELSIEISDGEASLARARDDLDTWRRALLKAAFTGKLTRDWRDRNDPKLSAVEYVAKLSLSLANNRRRRGPPDSSVDAVGRGNSDGLPDTWTQVEIGNVFEVATGATPKRDERRYYDGGKIPWVTSSVVNNPVVLEAAEFITNAAIEETNAKIFPPGTILVAMYGEGKTRGKATELGIAAATNQACAALLQPENETELRSYVKSWFEYNYLELRKQAAGGVQPNLNLEMIKRLRLPIPPREEMLEIVATLVANIDSFATTSYEMDQLHASTTGLRQSVLRAAFEGRLVDQDPSDEPADRLLARLGERADAPIPARSPAQRRRAALAVG
jgi:type I restriction enzyme S subunit